MGPPNDPPPALLDLIYDAATDGNLWIATLLRLVDMTGSDRGVLHARSSGFNMICIATRPLDGTDAVEAGTSPLSPWTRTGAHPATGAVAFSDAAVPYELFTSAGFLDEGRSSQEQAAHDVVVPIAATRTLIAAFRLQRNEDRGRFGEADYHLLARLAPHMSRSLRLGFRIDGYRALRRAESRVLDQFTGGVVLLDATDAVLFANAAAHAMMSAGGPLRMQDRTLLCASAPHAHQFDALIQGARHGTPTATMGLPHPADGRLVTIVVSPVHGPDISLFAEPHMRDAQTMIFVFDPAAAAEVPLDWIISAYGLTPAEARVALLTARGRSVGETAARLSLSSNTVKTHLRRVFAKTGAAGQVELAGMLAAIRGLAGGRSRPI